jgi:hypothetical protein
MRLHKQYYKHLLSRLYLIPSLIKVRVIDRYRIFCFKNIYFLIFHNRGSNTIDVYFYSVAEEKLISQSTFRGDYYLTVVNNILDKLKEHGDFIAAQRSDFEED